MAKYLTYQRYIFKIHSSRIKRSKWNLSLSIDEARETKELIALSESQVLRWIDELNGQTDYDKKVGDIKKEIKKLKKEKDISKTRIKIKKLYSEMDKYLFKPDYITVVIDSPKDYRYMSENGFKINNIKYKRLLGTTGGIKNSTIVFVSERLHAEIKRRIANGRNMEMKYTPAKLEAYQALTCSASTPVSMPEGVLVVHDCITHFKSDIIELDDSNVDEPKMKFIKDADVELNESDGYGLAMPSLMKKWANDLGEDYILPGCVIRNSFCKGAVFCVDFQKFAKDNNKDEIYDVWNKPHSIFNIELVITESMLKLWDAYSSIEDYLNNCEKNHYTFAITKASEENLENERTMNYQFLQSYDFSDDDINELIAPTMNEIEDILSGDYRKTILYTKGMGLNEKTVSNLDYSFADALMIEPKMINDPYVKKQLYNMIYKRINDAKIGVLNVPANYSLVSGDPYSLCQSMFNMEVTGLLKSEEMYSYYWKEKGVDKIATFRAPMSCHNNIRIFNIVHNEQMDEFYKYMKTISIFNSWDTSAASLNGLDKDGDAVINTSLDVIVRNTKKLPAIMCVQRKAPKCIPTEEDFVESNISSFGNAVGGTTNKVTSMLEVQAGFENGSREWNILDYRIKCGQLYQQNAIDKAKGIEAKPMPNQWYNWISNKIYDGKDNKEKKKRWMNRRILVDKKPYFMRYIYPDSNSEYENYMKDNNSKCLINFKMTLNELLSKDEKDLTSKEKKFIYYYKKNIPLGMNPCTINKICWKFEEKFDGYLLTVKTDFDYSILKSDAEYSSSIYKKIEKIYNDYKKQVAEYNQLAKKERIKSEDRNIQRYIMKSKFQEECDKICPNEDVLCNIVLDLCYTNSNSKQFAWDICGSVIIQNLLKRHDYKLSYPTLDPNGDIEFNGEKFKMVTTQIDIEEINKGEY